MGKTYTEAQAKATKKYQQNKAQIKIWADTDKADAYKQYAKSQGKTLTELITELLDKEIEELL